jgi:hypothetical protein
VRPAAQAAKAAPLCSAHPWASPFGPAGAVKNRSRRFCAAGNEGDVRQIRRSEFGRPKVGPQGVGQGPADTKTAAGRFSNKQTS